jgi:predicted MFS family arabinose efflux permease
MSSEPRSGAEEVRHYLKRLAIVIVCGALLMVIVAVVAWYTFARDFQETRLPAPLAVDAGMYTPPPR